MSQKGKNKTQKTRMSFMATERSYANVANFTRMGEDKYMFDNSKYNAADLKAAIADDERNPSPKARQLIKKIASLDSSTSSTMRYKHVVLSPNPDAAKFFATVLDAHGYKIVGQGTGNNSNQTKYIAANASDVKSIINEFNSVGNDNGMKFRFLVTDTDTYLKNVTQIDNLRFLHLMETISSRRKLAQITGTATKACSCKAIAYNANQGWTLSVYIYDVSLPSTIKSELGINESTKTLGELARSEKGIPADEIDDEFLMDLKEATEQGAFDVDLNQEMHRGRTGGGSGGSRGGGSGSGGGERGKKHVRFSASTVRIKKRTGGANQQPAIPAGPAPAKGALGKLGNAFGWGARALGILPAAASAPSGMRQMSSTPPGPPSIPGQQQPGWQPGQQGFQQQPGGLLPGAPTKDNGIMFQTRAMLIDYFKPASKQRGIVLWHSDRTDKVCTAAAIGTQFARPTQSSNGYAILFAKDDRKSYDVDGKNLIDEALNDTSCFSETDMDKRRGIVSHWVKPHLTFKEAASVVANRSKLQQLDNLRPNQEDKMEKVLLIVDGADLAKMRNSGLYDAISDRMKKTPTFRILLMTDDDFTKTNPKDLVALVALCKNKPPFDLTKDVKNASGRMSAAAKEAYMNYIAGYISRVDRAYDPSVSPIAQIEYIFADISNTKIGTPERAKKIGSALRFVKEKLEAEVKANDAFVTKASNRILASKDAKLTSELNRAIAIESEISKTLVLAYTQAKKTLEGLKEKTLDAFNKNNSQRSALRKLKGIKSTLDFNSTSSLFAPASAPAPAPVTAAAPAPRKRNFFGF